MYPPRIESRVGALERQQTMYTAAIFELSEDLGQRFDKIETEVKDFRTDMTASFKQLAEYQQQEEKRIDARFDKVEADIAEIKATMATKEDLAALETRLEGKMEAMETRMLDAFQQLLTMVETRLPKEES